MKKAKTKQVKKKEVKQQPKAQPVIVLKDGVDGMDGTEVVDNEHQKKEDRRDKIFGNDFNTGNITSENLPNIKIETDYSSSYLDDCYDAEEYMMRKDLMQRVYDIFKASQWGNLPLDKKFSKELMPFIFNDLYKGLAERGYPTVEVFICIAEFMDVSYEKVYEVAGIKVKEQILKELESKFKVLSKKKINRLF
jgi:hypothetical protein